VDIGVVCGCRGAVGVELELEFDEVELELELVVERVFCVWLECGALELALTVGRMDALRFENGTERAC
jgi:hypothetical protein